MTFPGQPPRSATETPGDELPAIGKYLHSLMCDVSDARSDLEENRRQLMNAEKLATAGKLAAGVAHEIRNPLTAMKMWLFSIRKAVGHDPRTGSEIRDCLRGDHAAGENRPQLP